MVLPRFEINIDQQITVPFVGWTIPIKFQRIFGDYDISVNLLGFRFVRDLKFQPGLDLQGGMRVVLETDMQNIPSDQQKQALESTKGIIERRINLLGVTQHNIFTSVSVPLSGETSLSEESYKYHIVVELPGVIDTKPVLDVIVAIAQLDFREESSEEGGEAWIKTELTGDYLDYAQVVFDSTSGQPAVQITFNEEGAKLFEEITRRNIDKRLGVFLDNRPITAPMVQQTIVGGQATISGQQFTTQTAKDLVVKLSAGALPIPVAIAKQKNISPSPGEEAVSKSIFAGLVGFGLIAVFLLIKYRLLGFFIAIGLIIYGLMNLAVYKFVPVTLTLAGITGFILSIGIILDGHILIFEQIKRELKLGRDKRSALNLGFTRSWEGIRDANTAVLIIVFLLFNPFNWSFLVTNGDVRSFALTLGIGIAVGLFINVIITKTLIYQFYRTHILKLN